MLKRELDLHELCQPSMAGNDVSVAGVQLERIRLHKSVGWQVSLFHRSGPYRLTFTGRTC